LIARAETLAAVAVQAAEAPARVAAWQMFPYGTLLTFATVLATLMLAALVNHLRSVFQTKESANEMGKALRGRIDDVDERIAENAQGIKEAKLQADEAYRMAQLNDRALGEQWARVSEQIIAPVKEMSRELRDTREMLVRYIEAQSSQEKTISNLERRVENLGKGGSQ
jgi:hypothetical protein